MHSVKEQRRDDAEWVQGAILGDEECFRLLVERHWAVMVGLALSKVKGRLAMRSVRNCALIS